MSSTLIIGSALSLIISEIAAAEFPWDYPLALLQDFVAGPLAHGVIVTAGIGAALVFMVVGDCELARRLIKAAFGTGVALLAVRFLNYIAL
jgi:type IV secretory pathway VirB2 component (pilin)